MFALFVLVVLVVEPILRLIRAKLTGETQITSPVLDLLRHG